MADLYNVSNDQMRSYIPKVCDLNGNLFDLKKLRYLCSDGSGGEPAKTDSYSMPNVQFLMKLQDGKKVTGLQEINGKSYYFDENGILQTGWMELNGEKHYFKKNGVMKTGWMKQDGKWYYFENDGSMATGWAKDDGKWYYMDEEGNMERGWQLLNGKWYYLSSDGSMATGWKSVSDKWYNFHDSGVMKTGWRKVDGKWYYMDENGVMQRGWLLRGGNWYYLGKSGDMSTGIEQINGLYYVFNENGECVNPEGSVAEITEDQLKLPEGWGNWSAEDIYYMQRCVETETRDCDFWSKTHVASVILNRVMDGYFGDTPYEVVTARCQFAYGRTTIAQSTIDAVNYVLKHGDTAKGALFFHSLSKRSTFCGRSYMFTDACGHHFYK
jgi:glucan-binding YG repeat protein